MSLKKKLTFLTVFTGAAIGSMHLINRLFHYIATVDNRVDKNKKLYYEWRFGKIAYTKKGSGKPLMLIHNLDVCSSSMEWEKISDELAKDHTVYNIDLLGCGCSDKPALTYTNFLYVQLITDFIKHVIGEKSDVIVSRESSAFVLMACANDNTVIDRVIMVNPQNLVTLAKIPTKRTKLIRYLLITPVIGTFIYNMKVNKRTISQEFVNAFYNHNKIAEKDILTCFEASQKEKTHSKYLYASKKSRYTNANIICCLNRLNNSIFIITGNSNPENALAASQYQNHLPSIEIIGIGDTKQVPHMERAEEFIEQVRILFAEEEDL